VDPQTAARLAPGDSQRIGRALEVWTATGQTLTSFHQSAKANAPNWHIPVISLEPQNRGWLHQRIARLDEAWQEERWGIDYEAADRTAARLEEALLLERWFQALG
jgi:tRNA dimethylallyltransferase